MIPIGMILIFCAVPLTVLAILLIKTADSWVAQLRAMPRMAQVLFVMFMGFTILWGGSKPGPVGPTKANLKLLLAQREQAKFNTGKSFGEKSVIVTADVAANIATTNVINAEINVDGASNTLDQVALDVPGIIAQERHYLRLMPAQEIYTGQSIYGETLAITVTNGVASAFCWFNVIPNSEPVMRFHFASETATNLWFSAIPTHSSFPATSVVDGKPCYTLFFDVPPVLLDDAGSLIAPLDFERAITFGSPETHEAFDLRGGLALYVDGKYWIAVTGWRTNQVSGLAYYFSDGRRADPPRATQAAEDENETF